MGKGLLREGVRWRVVAALVAALGALAFPSGAAALTGPQLLTFGEFGEGTDISTQYVPDGIVFAGEDGIDPEIRWDGSSFTNPTLSGPFGFGSSIEAKFVEPGTFTAATVENLKMDVGYINEPGSTVVTIERLSGPSIFYADEYGFNEFGIAANDITGFRVESVEGEPAGWELDNVAYVIPAPPPPPPPPAPVAAPPAAPSCPTYAIYDSRGSGETLNETSKPGKQFVLGFLQRLRALKNPSSISITNNPYPAVGVMSWTNVGIRANGIGALFGVHDLGAYYDSADEGRKEVLSFVRTQIAGACGSATKIILLGYSQGAQATGDAYTQMTARERGHVAAMVLWGDPHYNHKDHLADRDDRSTDGLLGNRHPFPNDAKNLKESKLFSYCNAHDIICQSLAPQSALYYRGKEHSLYYTTDEAKNNGSAVASFVIKH